MYVYIWGFPGGSDGKESACNAGDLGLIPGFGRSLGEGNGYPLQYFYLENPMDRGGWRATVHGVTKNWIGLKRFNTNKYIYIYIWNYMLYANTLSFNIIS